jgi:glycosyltransferase involved in cell wall biosynthesis
MKILYITQLLPYPLDTGGKIKTYKTIKNLAEKHQVFLVCFVPNKKKLQYQQELEKFCDQVKVFVWPLTRMRFRSMLVRLFLNLFSLQPFIFYRYLNKKMKNYIAELLNKKNFDAIHIDHLNMAQYLPDEKNCLWVLEEHNIESSAKKSIAEQENFPASPIFKWEAYRIKFKENQFWKKFDYIFAISPEDKEELVSRGIDDENIFVLPVPMVYKNYYQWGEKKILFIGLLSWWPNKDGLQWFIREVYPNLKKEVKNIKFLIVGEDAKPDLKQIAASEPSVELIGYVKEIEPYLKEAGCFILPFRMGGGVRIKLLTAMAAGIPVVGTKVGFQGLIGKEKHELLISQTKQDLITNTKRVLNNKSFALRITKEQKRIIKQYYSNENQTKILNKVY